MAQVIFDGNIVPLDRAAHRDLRIDAAGGRAPQAGNAHYVPLGAGSFFRRPGIIPSSSPAMGTTWVRFALLGLNEGENRFLRE
ncbi:MAG: hypothetical protein U5L11_00185 [Arhodomonas sp.]|nr:hypothetical protein [Arhodomonas sp.]